MIARPLLALTFIAAPLLAQSKAAPSAVADARALWRETAENVLQSAVDMPEAKFSYKPVATVRSFGEIIGHVAGSQSMFCALALGEKAPAEDAVEKTAKTKAALLDAMRASNSYCAKAYAQSGRVVRNSSGYYEMIADKLPYGTSRWWAQMDHEGRGGRR